MSDKEEKDKTEIQEDDGFIEYPPGLAEDDTKLPEKDEKTPEQDKEEKIEKSLEEESKKPEGEKPGEEPEKPSERFILKEEDELFDKPKDEPKEDEGLTDIIHQGRKVSLTKEQLINLAQKGFDYDYKIGPHGKLVQMIEADPNLAEVVNNYWRGKLKPAVEEKSESGFKVKPLGEYENEVDWLQDNLSAFGKSTLNDMPKSSAPESPGIVVKKMIAMHDPQYAEYIIPKMEPYILQLSIADYQKINADQSGARLLQFYDYVKEQEIAKARKPKGETEKKPSKPGFRVQSGGGSAPLEEDKDELAWNKPRAEFLAELEKVKYGR